MVSMDGKNVANGRWIDQALHFGLPGMVLGVAMAWVLGGTLSHQLKARQAPLGGQGGLIALTTEAASSPGTTRLFLIDPRGQSMAIYKIDGLKGGSIKLEAARQFGADLKLSEYNNLPPEVAAVEAMATSPRPRGGPGQ